MKVYESPHRDGSPRLCECGFVLPLLPPVGRRLINNGNAAALLKCQLATRRHGIIFVARRHSAGSRTRACEQNKLCDPSASSRTCPALPSLQVDDHQGRTADPVGALSDEAGSPSAAFRPSLKRQAASASLKVSPPAPSRQKNETQTGHSGVTDATPFQTPLRDDWGKRPTGPSAPCGDPAKVRIVSSNKRPFIEMQHLHTDTFGTSIWVLKS